MTTEREAPVTDLQPIIDEKVAALNERLRLIEKQDAAELAKFGPAPEPKQAKAK